MFRRRLSLVLLMLAACVVLQGVAAVFALRETERQVIRGRVASDILQGFIDLSATKQRLRSWVTQHSIGAGGDSEERDALERRMLQTLQDLSDLTRQAAAVGLVDEDRTEHAARVDALSVLNQSMDRLSLTIRRAEPMGPEIRARQAWDALTEVFEQSEGRDLRQLIAQSIARERAAMLRERAAADTSLARTRSLWIAMAVMLALGALLATVYFGRALRRPLDALAEGAHALQQGALQHRIDLTGRDEFADVARSMNAMADELEQHRSCEEQQRHLLEATVRERTLDLHRANESLQHTDLRRRQLLADISHELRTPTTAIRGEAEVTLRGEDKPAAEYREALRRIVDTSRQLGAVIDDLLAMARTDMETLSLARHPVSLKQPLLDALNLAAAIARDHRVDLQLDGPLPERLIVFGDAQRLTQLLLVLLDNAVRYSYPGGVVRWGARNDGDSLEVQVIDEGIGISSHELTQIFERHFRGSAARRHRASGSGLGLPIARALAHAHGGSLTIESPVQTHRDGRSTGTRAVLRLPLWAEPEPVATELLSPVAPHRA
jgi:two-component system, OmpR family, sensor kinase